MKERNAYKFIIMTAPYNATDQGVQDNLRDQFKEKGIDVCGEEYASAAIVSRLMRKFLDELDLKGLFSILEFYKKTADLIKLMNNEEGIIISNQYITTRLVYSREKIIRPVPLVLKNKKLSPGFKLFLRIKQKGTNWQKMKNSITAHNIHMGDSSYMFEVLQTANKLRLNIFPQHDSFGINSVFDMFLKPILRQAFINFPKDSIHVFAEKNEILTFDVESLSSPAARKKAKELQDFLKKFVKNVEERGPLDFNALLTNPHFCK